jgi:hypothetical protein
MTSAAHSHFCMGETTWVVQKGSPNGIKEWWGGVAKFGMSGEDGSENSTRATSGKLPTRVPSGSEWWHHLDPLGTRVGGLLGTTRISSPLGWGVTRYHSTRVVPSGTPSGPPKKPMGLKTLCLFYPSGSELLGMGFPLESEWDRGVGFFQLLECSSGYEWSKTRYHSLAEPLDAHSTSSHVLHV